MNVLKIIQKLTLATLLVLALGACSNKDNNDTNATGETTGTSQAGGEDGAANTGTGGNAGVTTNSTGTTTSTGGGTQSIGGGGTDETSSSSNDGTSVGTADNGENNTNNNTTDDSTVTDNNENNTTNQDNNASADNNTTQNTDNNTSTETNSTVDVTPPVLTLNGQANITLEQNAVYTELGATAVDAVDGNLTVSISGTVDTSTVGNYTLTYTATDSAGNEANVTRSVEVVNTAPTLTSITLESNATTVNVGDTIQLTVTGTYSDGSNSAVDENITYTIHPTDSAEVNGSVLTAKKDGNVTVQASIDGVNSNTIALNITWVVNGHVLPPEPDKALNDSTLLGIDTNNNGVRDDVERWIYETYKDKHPIHIDIGMQAGRASKLILEYPEKAKEITLKVEGALFCGWYYQHDAYRYGDPTLVNENIDGTVKSKCFNTKTRKDVYLQYDKLLSGGVYTLPRSKEMKALCDFNTSKYGE